MQGGNIRRVLVVVTLALCAGIAGCATAAKAIFTQPDVSFRGVGVRALGLESAAFDPTPDPVPLAPGQPKAKPVDLEMLRAALSKRRGK